MTAGSCIQLELPSIHKQAIFLNPKILYTLTVESFLKSEKRERA
jgi:hypothetical protein